MQGMGYNYTMNKKHVTTKIWRGTLDKIQIASALAGKSQIEFMDEAVNSWLTINSYDPDQITKRDKVVSWHDISTLARME